MTSTTSPPVISCIRCRVSALGASSRDSRILYQTCMRTAGFEPATRRTLFIDMRNISPVISWSSLVVAGDPSAPDMPTRGTLQLALAVLASFLGSSLLFTFEPYVGKLLLPAYGGTPLLWNTCVVFFQVALLAGYVYSLLLTRYLRVRWQAAIQLFVLGSLFVLYPGADTPIGDVTSYPEITLFAWLTRHALAPFVALAALTTIVQSWFASSDHVHSRNPYRLYAAGNAGSMLGLFAYPFVLEPQLTLAGQRTAAHILLGLLILTVATLALTVRVGSQTASKSFPADVAEAPAIPRKAWWRIVLLTAIPAGLLLSVTNYVLTDIASLPLFWIVPLSLYLTTFIIAFARGRRELPRWLGRVFAFLCVFVVVALGAEANSPAAILIPAHLAIMFLGSLFCHVAVASLVPHPRWLAQYYLAISAGGAVGGLVTLLLPPLLTDRFIEYPLVLALCTLALGAERPRQGDLREWALDLLAPALLVIAGTRAFAHFAPDRLANLSPLAFAPAALAMLNAERGPRLTRRILSAVVASLLVPSVLGHTVFAERDFFGRVRVLRDADRGFHLITHGSTIHGIQALATRGQCAPTAYYHPTGPAGRFLTGLPHAVSPRRIALVGVASGALACYARFGEKWDLYELNPTMARIATDTSLFTYLARSNAAAQRMIIGDARIALAASAAKYDVIILDAFSSDAIPIHLLTREAVEIYARHLTVSGVILVHISNRFFRLGPILAAVAPAARLRAYVAADTLPGAANTTTGKEASVWMLLAPRRDSTLVPREWTHVAPTRRRVWTDDYSNPLGVLRL